MKDKEKVIDILNSEAASLSPQVDRDYVIICLADGGTLQGLHGLKQLVRSLSMFGKVEIEDYVDRDTHYDDMAKLKFTPYDRET